ncbi:MAG: hypothetical protein AB7O98_07355 [Hyphomonadaceae bacterium]
MPRASRTNLAYRTARPAEREERVLAARAAQTHAAGAPWLRFATYAFLVVSCALFWWAVIVAFIQVL